MRLFRSMPFAIALLILPVSALADSVTTAQESFTLSGLGATEIVNFAQFDSSLGTLTGVAIEGSSTMSWSGTAGVGSNEGSFCSYPPLAVQGSITSGPSTLKVTDLGKFPLASPIGGGCPSHPAVSDSKSTSWGPDGLPGPYDAFMGSGNVPITFSLSLESTPSNGTISSASWTGDAELVYTYTPASAVPEPSTLLLFGTGALGVAAMLRRKISGV